MARFVISEPRANFTFDKLARLARHTSASALVLVGVDTVANFQIETSRCIVLQRGANVDANIMLLSRNVSTLFASPLLNRH